MFLQRIFIKIISRRFSKSEKIVGMSFSRVFTLPHSFLLPELMTPWLEALPHLWRASSVQPCFPCLFQNFGRNFREQSISPSSRRNRKSPFSIKTILLNLSSFLKNSEKTLTSVGNVQLFLINIESSKCPFLEK